MGRRASGVWCVAIALLTSPCLAVPRAQRNQPVYPAYDGFLRNPGGGLTLSFAYFSHSAEVVTIPAGPGNSFAPDPADCQQPVAFRPGHQRFQCIMVVGPDFVGKPLWTVSDAVTTTGTSPNMLQSNHNLVEGAAALREIEYATVPRGVCLNRAPVVRVLGGPASSGGTVPALSAIVAEQMNLFGSVTDEGLPRGATMTAAWQVIGGSGAVTFEDPAAARARVVFSAPGAYDLELSANDSMLTNRTRVRVNVVAASR